MAIVLRGAELARFRNDLVRQGLDAAAYYSAQYLQTLYRRYRSGEINLVSGLTATSLDTKLGLPKRQSQGSAEREFPAKKQKAMTDNRTDLTCPSGPDLGGGRIQIGDKPTLTTSHSTLRLRRLGRKYPTQNGYFIARYQSIRSVPTTGLKNLSKDLAWINRVRTSDDLPLQMTGAYLPMYAFDLTTIPGNVFNSNTKSFFDFQSVPFYRLKKNYSNLTPLDNNVANYVWEADTGYQNGPSNSYVGTNSPYWSLEVTDKAPCTMRMATHEWSEIDFMLKCNQSTDCKVHVAIVKFLNGAGPSRLFTTGDIKETYAHNENFVATKTVDKVPDAVETSGVDVFWESFWDRRTAHPLAQFNQEKMNSRIRFLKHEIIDVHPDTKSQGAFSHVKKIFVSGGRTQDFTDNFREDQTDSRGEAFVTDGAFGPVYAQNTGGVDTGFTHGFGYNHVKKGFWENLVAFEGVYDQYAKEHPEGNVWLLIWMDDPIQDRTHHTTTDYDPDLPVMPPLPGPKHWPPTGAWVNLMDQTKCCTFDFKVRSKFSFVPNMQIQDGVYRN